MFQLLVFRVPIGMLSKKHDTLAEQNEKIPKI